MPSSSTVVRKPALPPSRQARPAAVRPLRVGFVSQCERADRTFYSEIPFQMAEAFQRLANQGTIEFEYLGPIEDDPTLMRRLGWRQRIEKRVTGKISRPEFYPPITRGYIRQVTENINGRRFDLLVGNWSWHALLSHIAPVVLLRDATIAQLERQAGYEYFNNSSKLSRNWAHHFERKAASDCLVQFFTSQWAIDSAITDYGASANRVAVLPFGANFGNLPSRFEVLRQIDNRDRKTCRLLFVGREWERKGGDIAVHIVNELNALGIHAVLDVVGSEIPSRIKDEPHVRIHGLLSKDRPKELDKLTRLFMESHYLLVPSRAECFGIVYAEASAFGLPSIAQAVGGVAGAVSERNGFLLPPDTSARDAAALIRKNFVDSERYMHLARSARHEYEWRFNWDSVVRELLQVSAERLGVSAEFSPSRASAPPRSIAPVPVSS